MGFLVGFPCLYAVVFVVSFEAVDVIALLLEAHDVVDDLFTAWAAVDVVAKEVEMVVLGDF